MTTLWDRLCDVSVHTLATALPPATCRRCIQARIFPHDWTVLSRQPIPLDSPLRGEVKESKFNITRRGVGVNRFQVYAEGSVVPDGFGSRICVRLQMQSWAIPFLGCWIIAASGLQLMIIIAILFGHIAGGPLWVFAIPMEMALYGMWAYTRARRHSRRDQAFLLDWLKRTLDAADVPERLETVER